MTLFKQIAVLVSLLFFLLTGIFIINDLNRAGNFLQGQLKTTAQDMATTLGIVISNLPKGDDIANLEVLFNSVFDSGYYTSIKLVALDGSVIHQKSQSLQVASVPDWFIQLVTLSAAEGSTRVMKGWTQLGQLKLKLHPGFAYRGLYESLVSTLKWFALLFSIAIIILWLLLKYLLAPLQKVKEQADSIHNNQFVQQNTLPSTIELKTVVEAMNSMVSKVQSVFNDQEKTLVRYQHLLYHDKITGLGNRRYMLDQIQQSLNEESSFHGCLGIIKIVNFGLLQEKQGYEKTDNLLKTISRLITEPHAELSASKTARLSEDEFAFLISADEDSVSKFIDSLYQQMKNDSEFNEIIETHYLVAGIVALESGCGMGELLSNVDYCLTRAISMGPFTIEKNKISNITLPHGKMQWRSWLEDIVNEQRLFMVGQMAMNKNNTAMQKELFIRTRNEQNQIIPASAFMPMASSLGMAIEIDKAVFTLIKENNQLDPTIPVAVNLSAAFFELAEVQEEFDQLLTQSSDKGLQLCIEASHHVLLKHPVMSARVSDRVKGNGHLFGIDNLDLGQSMQLLQSTRFDYVKINAKTLCAIATDELSAGYQAFKTMADTMGLLIIAVGVDSQAVYDQLTLLGIDAMQGNFLNEPVELLVD